MTEKIKRFLAENRLGTPALVVDLGRVVDNYRRLARLLPGAEIYYAIKANPAPPILEALAGAADPRGAGRPWRAFRCCQYL